MWTSTTARYFPWSSCGCRQQNIQDRWPVKRPPKLDGFGQSPPDSDEPYSIPRYAHAEPFPSPKVFLQVITLVMHVAQAHHKSQAARGKLFDTFQKHLGKEFRETDLEIILHFMRHRARLLIPFNAVAELASFVGDPAARRRNMFERAVDNGSKKENPTLGVGDLVVRVWGSNKLVVKGDIHQVWHLTLNFL